MSLDAAFYALWQLFSEPIIYAAALITSLGVTVALYSAIAHIGQQSEKGGNDK